MLYDTKQWSFGSELEFGDVKFGQELPEGSSWNTKDNTCMNSNGVANDPLGKIWPYGGEINTKPTNTISEQLDVIKGIIDVLDPAPVVNHRSNLHLHIRVPGLKDDLESCKKILRYVDQYTESFCKLLEYIPKPDRSRMSKEAYDGAMKRYNRRHKSHQHKLPKSRVDAMLAATTTQEFFEEHAPMGKNDVRMWYFSPRACVNLRQLWEETNTIEFRHFPGTLNLEEYESSLRWCFAFLHNILNSDDPVSPKELYDSLNAEKPLNFPEFVEYDYELETMYQWTNFDTNTRKVVEERIAALKAEGKI